MMKRAIRRTLLFSKNTPHGSPIDFVFNLTERFFETWNGSLWHGGERVPKKGNLMFQLEYLLIEIRCVCEAKADETGPIYFCEAHHPGSDTDTPPSYPTN